MKIRRSVSATSSAALPRVEENPSGPRLQSQHHFGILNFIQFHHICFTGQKTKFNCELLVHSFLGNGPTMSADTLRKKHQIDADK